MTTIEGKTPVPTRRYAWAALVGLAAYLILLAFLFRPTGGLVGRYSTIDGAGQPVLVHERVDRAIDFPVPQRMDAAYIFNWNERTLGFPSTMPTYSVRWSGLLRAPVDGVYGFMAEAHGEASLSLDGQDVNLESETVSERYLEAGWHAIAVAYRLTRGEAMLVLRWRPPGRSLRPIPTSSLAPDHAAIDSGGSRRGWGWGVLAAGVLAALLAWFAARRPGSAPSQWVSALATERTLLALGLILMLAAVLRFHDYALVPFHHETADEYQHAWEGWHLLHEMAPAAWSTFPDRYPPGQTVDFRWFGDRYILVKPYFDHPPLFSILVGLVTSLKGPPTYAHPWDFLSGTLPAMRLIPILLSLVGVVLLHRLAIAYGAAPRAALLAALVYATLPPIILAHRLVKAESLLVLLFMGAILAVRGARPAAARWGGGVAAGLLCGLSIWTKATGVAVVATVLILLLSRRRYREAAVATAITSGFLLLYLLYAWAYDFGIFLEVISAQSTSKWVSLETVLDLLGGKVVVKWFGRGWYLWLLLATGLATLRKERGLLLPVALYGILIALTADHRVVYGWYRIPLYPFLCIAAGIYLHEMIREADLYRVFPFAATAVATGLLYALPGGLAQARWVVVVFAVLALGPYLLREVFDRPFTARLARAGAYLQLILFLVTCLATVGGLLEIYAAGRGVQ